MSKRTRQVIRLAVLRDGIQREKGFPIPCATAIAWLEREYAELSKTIINDMLAAHDKDRERGQKLIGYPEDV